MAFFCSKEILLREALGAEAVQKMGMEHRIIKGLKYIWGCEVCHSSQAEV